MVVMLEVVWGAMMVTMGKWCGDCGDSTGGDGCEGQGGSGNVGWWQWQGNDYDNSDSGSGNCRGGDSNNYGGCGHDDIGGHIGVEKMRKKRRRE